MATAGEQIQNLSGITGHMTVLLRLARLALGDAVAIFADTPVHTTTQQVRPHCSVYTYSTVYTSCLCYTVRSIAVQ
jgi:hypothetical protein